jgi:hypothetical protein
MIAVAGDIRIAAVADRARLAGERIPNAVGRTLAATFDLAG